MVVQVSTLTGMLKVGFLSSAFLEIKVTTPQDSLNGVIHSEVASRASFQRELFFLIFISLFLWSLFKLDNKLPSTVTYTEE